MNKIKYIKASEGTAAERINIKAIVRGVLSAVIICLMLLIILAVVFTYSNLGGKYFGITSKIVFFVGAVLSGFFSSIGAKKSGWLLGGFSGLIYSILLSIFGMLAAGVYNFGIAFLKNMVLSVLFGVVGGIAGINFKFKGRK